MQVQQAGDVLDGEGSRKPRAFKTEDSEGQCSLKGGNPPSSPQSPASGKSGMSEAHLDQKQEEGEGRRMT